MSINRSILTGAIWVVAARWGIRGIGLISTLILVRLLTPADFGVVAMAMIVVGMVEVFGETGLVLYVIRHPDPKDDHFNTVWTLRLIVGLVLAAVLFLGAEQGAIFFNEPAIEPAIQLLALRPLMLGLENPGILWFRKNMEFNRDFEFLVLNKIVAFVVTIALAYWLRNYWALVFGILTGGLAALLQSYRMWGNGFLWISKSAVLDRRAGQCFIPAGHPGIGRPAASHRPQGRQPLSVQQAVIQISSPRFVFANGIAGTYHALAGRSE